MTNTTTKAAAFTAIEIAAALAGRVAAWSMILASLKSNGLSSLDKLASDIRAEIARLPIPTNTRKGAGKTLSNYVSLIRRAVDCGVAVEGAVAKLEKACATAENVKAGVVAGNDATATGADDATATATGAGADDALAAMTAERDALADALAAMTAERDALAAQMSAIAACATLKAVKVLLAA